MDFLRRHRHVHKTAAVLQFLLVRQVPHLDVSRLAGVGNVKLFVVSRETNSIRLLQFVAHHFHFAALGVDAINRLFNLQFALVSFVIHHRAVAGVSEPNAAVRMNDDVVGRVERFVLPLVSQHGDGTIVLVADDAPVAVFAGKLAPFEVERVAVAVAAGIAEHADVAVLLEQAHLAVVRNVAPDKVTANAVPGATLSPQRSSPELLNRCVADLVFGEPLVEHDDVGIGIAHRILPRPVALGGERLRRNGRAGGGHRGSGEEPATVDGVVFHGGSLR